MIEQIIITPLTVVFLIIIAFFYIFVYWRAYTKVPNKKIYEKTKFVRLMEQADFEINKGQYDVLKNAGIG